MIDCYNEVAPNLKSSILTRTSSARTRSSTSTAWSAATSSTASCPWSSCSTCGPAPGYADYRTPVPGLYYASSATHAGGGVCGIPGMQAARAAIADRRAALRPPQVTAPDRRWTPRQAASNSALTRDARGPERGAGRRQRPPGQPRRADDRGGGQEPVPPAHLPRQPALRRHRRRALPAGSRGAPDRSTWPCSQCLTTRWSSNCAAAARSQARSAVLFGNAFDPPAAPGYGPGWPRSPAAGMPALCGAGCMGFVNVARGLRAIGYVEPDPLPAGPVALVTHSGSVFSALLRTRRGFGFSLAVSSGQELVTTAADYARYALELAETRVLGPGPRGDAGPPGCARCWPRALTADVPMVLLSVGASKAGQALVVGPLRRAGRGRRRVGSARPAPGLHRVRDLAELADTLELFAAPPAPAPAPASPPCTISGLERAHTADLAANGRRAFAPITRRRTPGWPRARPGLATANPLDVWGPAATPSRCSPSACPRWPTTRPWRRVALAVDLVPEFDGDESYPRAALTGPRARPSRSRCWPGCRPPSTRSPRPGCAPPGSRVLEGTRTGLLALRHLLDHAARPAALPARPDPPAPARRWGPAPGERPRVVRPAARVRHPRRAHRPRRHPDAALDVAADAIG